MKKSHTPTMLEWIVVLGIFGIPAAVAADIDWLGITLTLIWFPSVIARLCEMIAQTWRAWQKKPQKPREEREKPSRKAEQKINSNTINIEEL